MENKLLEGQQCVGRAAVKCPFLHQRESQTQGAMHYSAVKCTHPPPVIKGANHYRARRAPSFLNRPVAEHSSFSWPPRFWYMFMSTCRGPGRQPCQAMPSSAQRAPGHTNRRTGAQVTKQPCQAHFRACGHGQLCDLQPSHAAQVQGKAASRPWRGASAHPPTCTVALPPGWSDSLMRTIWERTISGSSGGVGSL